MTPSALLTVLGWAWVGVLLVAIWAAWQRDRLPPYMINARRRRSYARLVFASLLVSILLMTVIVALGPST